MIIPIILAIAGVLLFGGIVATSENSPTQTNVLERRYNAQNRIPNAPKKAVPREADMAVAPSTEVAPPTPSFTSEGKGYKTAAPCLTDAWLAGVRDQAELKKHCSGK